VFAWLRIKRLTAAPMLEMKWLFCVAFGEAHVFLPLLWPTAVAPSFVAEDIATFWAERKRALNTAHTS
jgi:hypothetical protein